MNIGFSEKGRFAGERRGDPQSAVGRCTATKLLSSRKQLKPLGSGSRSLVVGSRSPENGLRFPDSGSLVQDTQRAAQYPQQQRLKIPSRGGCCCCCCFRFPPSCNAQRLHLPKSLFLFPPSISCQAVSRQASGHTFQHECMATWLVSQLQNKQVGGCPHCKHTIVVPIIQRVETPVEPPVRRARPASRWGFAAFGGCFGTFNFCSARSIASVS